MSDSEEERTRWLVWSGCTNVRDLGGQPLEAGGFTKYGYVIRADNVRLLTAAGISALAQRGVRRIVDLRWHEELEEDPPPSLPVEVVHVPVLGRYRPDSRYERFARLASDVDDESAFVRRLYGEYLDEFPEAFAAAVEAVATSPDPVVIHCTAGKDRTGIVAALILRLVGVGIEAVAADYALTDVEPLLKRGLADGMSESETRARRFLFSAPRAGMAQFLDDLDERHGSAAAFLERARLPSTAADELRRRLAPAST